MFYYFEFVLVKSSSSCELVQCVVHWPQFISSGPISVWPVKRRSVPESESGSKDSWQSVASYFNLFSEQVKVCERIRFLFSTLNGGILEI